MPHNSDYVLQTTEKSFCPECRAPLTLLCQRNGDLTPRKPWFYICFACKLVAHVGKGQVYDN